MYIVFTQCFLRVWKWIYDYLELPGDSLLVFLRWFNGLSESVRCGAILSNISGSPEVLDFVSDTIEKDIINLCSNDKEQCFSCSYWFSDPLFWERDECSLSSISLLNFVLRLRFKIGEVCRQMLLSFKLQASNNTVIINTCYGKWNKNRWPGGFNNGHSSKFHEGSRVWQTPEEGRRTYRPKRYGNNNKDEDNSPKNPYW